MRVLIAGGSSKDCASRVYILPWRPLSPWESLCPQWTVSVFPLLTSCQEGHACSFPLAEMGLFWVLRGPISKCSVGGDQKPPSSQSRAGLSLLVSFFLTNRADESFWSDVFLCSKTAATAVMTCCSQSERHRWLFFSFFTVTFTFCNFLFFSLLPIGSGYVWFFCWTWK